MRPYYNYDEPPRRFRVSFGFGWTTTVKALIALNVAAFIATLAAARLAPEFNVGEWLGMFAPKFRNGAYWQPITYMFLHGGLWHLLGNMLGLYFFAGPVEAKLGRWSFLAMYFACGVAGAMLSLIQPTVPVIGASGGVFGVLIAFAVLNPDARILLMMVIPIRARTLAIGYALLTVVNLLGAQADGIAHWAHLGGIAVGFAWVKAIPGWRRLADFWSGKRERWEANRSEAEDAELDRILAKVHSEGITALTNQERDFLNLMSRRRK